MSEQKKQWKLDTAKGVADALNWLRFRSEGRVLVLVAIGKDGIAYSKHPDVPAEDAAQFVEDELANLRQGLKRMEASGETRGAQRRREF